MPLSSVDAVDRRENLVVPVKFVVVHEHARGWAVWIGSLELAGKRHPR
jgi:hypothetical protein